MKKLLALLALCVATSAFAGGESKKVCETNPKTKKDAARRKSFCARMSGMPGPMKDEKGRPTRKAASLKRWNCK